MDNLQMKMKMKTFFLSLFCFVIVGCNSMIMKPELEDGTYRLESYKAPVTEVKVDQISLACYQGRVAVWQQGYRLSPENKVFLVNAQYRHFYALVEIEANLTPNNRYKLNRSIDKDTIDIWIENEITGERVTKAKTALLKFNRPNGLDISRQDCKPYI